MTKRPIITRKQLLFVGAILAVLVSAFKLPKIYYEIQRNREETRQIFRKAKLEEKPALDIVLGRLNPYPLPAPHEGKNVWALDGQFTVFNPTPWPVEGARIEVWKHLGIGPDSWLGAWKKWTPLCWKDVLIFGRGRGSFTSGEIPPLERCRHEDSRRFKPGEEYVQWITPQLTANPTGTYCEDKKTYTMVVQLTWKKGKPIKKYILIHCTPSAKKPPAKDEFIWKLADGLPKDVSLPAPLRP